MIAQEERIFDEYFLRRISEEEAEEIFADKWPNDFINYERVLNIGHTVASPCVFLDEMSGSLVSAAQDLRKARPEITVDEIARLLGVTPKNAKRLLQANDGDDKPLSAQLTLAFVAILIAVLELGFVWSIALMMMSWSNVSMALLSFVLGTIVVVISVLIVNPARPMRRWLRILSMGSIGLMVGGPIILILATELSSGS